MSKFRKLCAAAAITASFVAVAPANAAVIQLGFILDRSGSIGSTNWTTIVNGLSTAVNTLIPVGGSDTYEISVVKSASTASINVNSFLVTDTTTRSNLATLIAGIPFTGGGTAFGPAFDAMRTALTDGIGVTAGDAAASYVNFATDGVQADPAAGLIARNALIAAGIDNISVEGIGSGVDASDLKTNYCYPGPCDDTSPQAGLNADRRPLAPVLKRRAATAVAALFVAARQICGSPNAGRVLRSNSLSRRRRAEENQRTLLGVRLLVRGARQRDDVVAGAVALAVVPHVAFQHEALFRAVVVAVLRQQDAGREPEQPRARRTVVEQGLLFGPRKERLPAGLVSHRDDRRRLVDARTHAAQDARGHVRARRRCFHRHQQRRQRRGRKGFAAQVQVDRHGRSAPAAARGDGERTNTRQPSSLRADSCREPANAIW
jgi:hypothetical protein